MNLSIIAAVGRNGEIGKDNKIPWRIPEDMKRFKELTSGHTVIMGRKTFESIGKVLPNRNNIVISRNNDYKIEGGVIAHSLEEAFKFLKKETETFVIGGAEIYKLALPYVSTMYITKIDKEFEADSFFPKIDEKEWNITYLAFHNGRKEHEGENIDFAYLTYKRKR